MEKLEGETLPTYFRHNRFQSLVRQLNFYNFRKVNRERTFWVYRHPLFHRDKPETLHLLRRRTCPGVDGRKHKPDYDIQTLESTENLEFPGQDNLTHDRDIEQQLKIFPRAQRPKRSVPRRSKVKSKQSDEDSIVDDATAQDPEYAPSVSKSSPNISQNNDAALLGRESKRSQAGVLSEKDIAKRARTERLEQSLMVSHVAQRLEEYAKRAESEGGHSSKRLKGVGAGIVTPPSDTMKYYALTYDDEAIYEPDEDNTDLTASKVRRRKSVSNDQNQEKSTRKRVEEKDMLMSPNVVVTDDCDSDRDSSPLKSESSSTAGQQSGRSQSAAIKMFRRKVFDQVPVRNLAVVSSLIEKLKNLNEALGVVAMFFMGTAPHDALVSEKIFEVIKSCDHLNNEFNLYRSALHPERCVSGNTANLELVHDFKVFCVNCLQQFLNEVYVLDENLLDEKDHHILKETTDLWVESLVY